jgi:hypothetical protein
VQIPRQRLREVDVIALVTTLLCVVLGIASSHALNADGVSYLDLAKSLRAGEWSRFMQTYWSPLYPAIVALGSVVAHREGTELLPVVHGMNTMIGALAIGVVWRHLRDAPSVALQRMSFAALLLSSARPLRIDAVTPDLLLLCIVALLAFEILARGSERWWLVGSLLGVAFLAKTSALPWIALAIAGLAWESRSWRRPVLVAAVTTGIALTWIVPMSVEAGRLTFGDAGRLNYCWYLRNCDSRTPDTHAGDHVSYRVAAVPGVGQIRIATFGDAWTYAPWSDPGTWDAGVRSRAEISPTASSLLKYWLTNARFVIGLWLLPLLLAVLGPAYLLARRARSGRRSPEERRRSSLTILLGALGIGQFIAVHAEPRLFAPFALMLALGALWSLVPVHSTSEPESRRGRRKSPPRRVDVLERAASLLGLVVSVPFIVFTLMRSIDEGARVDEQLEAVRRAQRAAPISLSFDRIVIVGPALPFEVFAFRLGGRVVAQVPPASASTISALPPPQRAQVLSTLFGRNGSVAWLTESDGTFRLVPILPSMPMR